MPIRLLKDNISSGLSGLSKDFTQIRKTKPTLLKKVIRRVWRGDFFFSMGNYFKPYIFYMKHIQSGFTFIMLVSFAATVFAQDLKKGKMKKVHQVVMQVTEGDSLIQLAVIGQVRNIKKKLPDAQIEVVCHANSLDMLLKSGSKVASHIAGLTSDNVRFVACENTMERKKATVEDLVPGVETVPSGLVEIILKQEEGWSYVKGGH